MQVNTKQKLLVIGASAVYSLECSYLRAAEHLGMQVLHVDPGKEVMKYARWGKAGRVLHHFLPIEAWERKMNRELVITIKNFQPDFILLATTSPILYGSLITAKLLSNATIIWIWPDTPMNLTQHNINNSRIIDLSAIYSERAIDYFKKLGFSNPIWIPLAGDTLLHGHPLNEKEEFHCDLSFVGMWRPEREEALSHIVHAFPDLSIELYGHYWKRSCKDKGLLSKWKGEGIVGKELAQYFNRSRINVNIIDDTNYPAANMRFFEVLTAGGLQLTSSCPEMSSEFRDREDLVYFSDKDSLLSSLQWILQNPAACKQIRKNGKEKIDNKHNYIERLKAILKEASNHKKQ